MLRIDRLNCKIELVVALHHIFYRYIYILFAIFQTATVMSYRVALYWIKNKLVDIKVGAFEKTIFSTVDGWRSKEGNMSNPDEFKILLATDIHLGYQHKHEVSVPPPRLSRSGVGLSSVSRCAWFLPQEFAERNTRLKRTAIQSLPEGWIISILLSYCTLKHITY